MDKINKHSQDEEYEECNFFEESVNEMLREEWGWDINAMKQDIEKGKINADNLTIEEWLSYINNPKKKAEIIAELEAEYGKDYEAIKLMKMDDV